ncbi:MAG: bifunctional oligoribonuclease/PAP phosphatase NrnA [Clostridia bacterium]|nr:bifunctional oligoribonuclease/PAP phosphatase NrnA [Clostridia bacterium]
MNPSMKIILDKIKAYRRILLFRHIRPDGDAVGSTKGLAEILRLTYPEKEIYLQNEDASEYLSFLGGEDAPIEDALYTDALGIVLDTAIADRISNKKYTLCRELIKIDHHIAVESYAPCEWVEPQRSSCCEMIAHFYDSFRDELKVDQQAATYIYAGMVTDSGRFRFRSVTGETLRLAGMLLDMGIETEPLFAHLYLREHHTFAFEAYVLKNMKLTEHGVASIYISKATQEKFSLSREDAGEATSYMDAIKGALIWIVFIEAEDGSIRVRLRSRFVTVNQLAERYRGGGHDCACGATVYSRREASKLLREADAILKEYKATHEGWL